MNVILPCLTSEGCIHSATVPIDQVEPATDQNYLGEKNVSELEQIIP